MRRLKAIYRSWAIPCASKQVYAPRHRAEWLGKITEAGVHRRAELYYQQLDALRSLHQLFRMTGADLSQIDGIDVMTAMTILSEAGWDMGKWETEDHFVSWLRLCPDNRISGDKIIGKGRLPTNNRVTLALKMAASTLRLSNTYLGAQFRRFRTKLGAPIAIKAMAAKLARLVYRMLKYGQQYVDKGAEYYEQRNRQQQIEFLRRKAAQLGLQVTAAHA
jgi:hypothetical protein